jgi:hypothetical protein
LTSSGGVKCWGWNSDGQLGDGTRNEQHTPSDVIGLSTGVIAIVAKDHHTCAVLNTGGVKCWGDAGELGNGTIDDHLTPVDMIGLSSGIIGLATGASHTCALTNEGGVKCWGDNYYGELGDGTSQWSIPPVDVLGLSSGITALTAGMFHTCALTIGGGVKCWGWNQKGQLGDGTRTDRHSPVYVVGLHGKVKWTFMVYLDGDNDFEDYAIDDFLEMSSVGSSPEVAIVVQFDRAQGYNTTNGDWQDTRRFYITKGMKPIAANGVSIGQANMGDPLTLIDFVQWSMSEYPAQQYALILWDHGNGWLPYNIAVHQNTIAEDLHYKDALDMDELRFALSTLTNGGAHPFDLFGMDACLMATIEVDSQIHPFAKVRVGSQEDEPFDGWPYDTILSALILSPLDSPEQLGSTIVEYYFGSCNNDNTMSVIRSTDPFYNTLETAVDNLAIELINHGYGYMDKIIVARNYSQHFNLLAQEGYQLLYIDLYDFADQLMIQGVNDPYIIAKAQSVKEAISINNVIIDEKHGLNWPGAHGISIYFPINQNLYNNSYDGYQGFLQFTADTRWDEWLHAYYDNTPPPPGTFSKSAPANGSNASTSPTLAWGASGGATGYEYCYDTSDNNVCNTSWGSAGTSTNAVASGLTNNTTYYWQVRSVNVGGTTYADSGTWWSFKAITQTFADVPIDYPFWAYIEAFYHAGITGGCGTGPLIFCPNNPVTRSSMAVFLLRAEHGSSYAPPAASHYFADLPVAGKEWMEPWVDQFYREGITGGCGTSPLIYCPENPVTRAAMAVFILRAKYGSSYTPPAASHFFVDMPVAGKEWMEPWVDELYREGISTGCGTSPLIYCPETAVTRKAMAAFIVRAFNLPMP